MVLFVTFLTFGLAFIHVQSSVLPEDWEEYVPPGSPRSAQPGNGSMFQGDIDMDKGEAENAVEADLRWPDALVPYEIDPAFSKSQAALIRRMMEFIQSLSCVEFKQRGSERDYIHFRPGTGCSSKLGRYGGKQFITLNQPNCMEPGIIAHEILHALGFLHEQSRPDRDRYVKIILQNIPQEFRDQFHIKANSDILGTQYDYGSIMHYGMFDFADNAMYPTIIPARKGVRTPIGQRDELSPTDILRINLFYDCPPVNADKPATLKPSTISTTTSTSKPTTSTRTTASPINHHQGTPLRLTDEELRQILATRAAQARVGKNGGTAENNNS